MPAGQDPPGLAGRRNQRRGVQDPARRPGGRTRRSRGTDERHESQRATLVKGIRSFDADATIAAELSRIGQLVVGQVEEASRESVDAFRVALKRLFVGFELMTPEKPFGAGVLTGGQVWTESTPGGEEPDRPMMTLTDGSQLLPVVRPEVFDLGPDDVGFPAMRRVALAW